MSEKRMPEIRFKGYTDPWEQRKLLDCIQKITDFRGRTPKKLGMDWSETGYLALSALNVKDGYIDFSQDVHYGDQALYDKWMTGNELHKGQVIFTTEAPMGNVAQIPDNRRYILSQRTIAFDAKLDLITENFLATVLRTPIVFASLTALSSGGTAKGVSQKSLATVDITLPVSLEEQERVASMFAGIDNLITLHQRKYDKLVKVKKAMLEKMFPQGDAKVPEIRFAGFTDPWEQRKLGDMVSIKTGKLDANAATEDGIYAFFTCGKETLRTDTYAFEGNAILISGNGDLGFTRRFSGRFNAYQRTYVLQEFSDNYEFIEHCIHRYLPARIRSESFGGAMPYIKLNTLSELELYVPKPGSQEIVLIANYLSNLDRLITLHQRKLEKLKNLKSAMLSKMFV